MRRRTRLLPKSAKTGRIVTMSYARRHPSTTVVQRVKVSRRRKKQ